MTNMLDNRSLRKQKPGIQFQRKAKENYQLYLIILIPLVWLLIFRYIPMFGIQIAFKNFQATLGIFGSEWVGLKNFIKFFNNYQFSSILLNTITISVYQLVASFPLPIILALALNATIRPRFKKTVQMVTYMPHFISVVVLVGMIIQFTSPRVGIINTLITAMGGKAIDFLAVPSYFSSIYVWSGIWQNCGWGTIIYLAALAGVDPELHEAAMIDGATRFQRIRYVDIPAIIPTTVIMLILSVGNVMSLGFEKIYLMQNSLNRDASQVISTYVYQVGLASSNADFSYAAAVGLFNSVINLVLVVLVNKIANKVSNTSLW